MPYFVTVTLSPKEWEGVLVELTPLIGQHVNKLDTLAPAELADVLRTVMKTALARHHRWLAERGIGAVISPVEDNERTFCFEFTDRTDARLFAQEFEGELRGNCPLDTIVVAAARVPSSIATQGEGGSSVSYDRSAEEPQRQR